MRAKKLKSFVRERTPRILAGLIKVFYYETTFLLKHKNYRGKKVYCPCCNKYFAKFSEMPTDAENINSDMYPENLKAVICPYCRSSPRHRIVCDYFNKYKSNIFPQKNRKSKIIVFAPNYGMQKWFHRNKIPFVSVDLYDRTFRTKIDIENISYSDNSVDFISCDHILEHVTDYHRAIAELHRVVKSGGYVEITVPLLPNLDTTYEDASITTRRGRIKAFGQSDHMRIFGRDFKEILKKKGFEVTVYDGDCCDKRIVPITGAAVYNYNKVFICRKVKQKGKDV